MNDLCLFLLKVAPNRKQLAKKEHFKRRNHIENTQFLQGKSQKWGITTCFY